MKFTMSTLLKIITDMNYSDLVICAFPSIVLLIGMIALCRHIYIVDLSSLPAVLPDSFCVLMSGKSMGEFGGMSQCVLSG